MRIDCGICVIRPYRLDDKPALVRNANNRNVWANMRDLFPHPYTEEAADGWLAHATTATPMANFAIEVDWLGEDFWGKGIATAAIRGFTPRAFEAFELERIYATPFHWNVASCRALEKASFNKEGVMRHAALKDGVLADMPIYARLRRP